MRVWCTRNVYVSKREKRENDDCRALASAAARDSSARAAVTRAGGQSSGGSCRSATVQGRQARREAAAGGPSGRHRRELEVGSCKCGAAGSCKCGETKPAPRFLGSQSGPSGRLGTKRSPQKKHPLDRVPTALARVSIVFRKRSRCPPLPPAHADQVAGGYKVSLPFPQRAKHASSES